MWLAIISQRAKMAKTNSKPRKTAASIYVIAGKEPSLISAESEKLIDELLTPQQKTTGLLNAEPDKVSITEILDELRTIPFLTDKRVVLVKEADKFISENRELLEKYFDAPSPTGILVLTVNTWQSNTKLAKKLPKVGKLISITQPKPWQLPGRLTQYAADAHDKKLNRQAAELLIELTADNLPRLYGEIDKLALFADKEKSITTAHILSFFAISSGRRPFSRRTLALKSLRKWKAKAPTMVKPVDLSSANIFLSRFIAWAALRAMMASITAKALKRRL